MSADQRKTGSERRVVSRGRNLGQPVEASEFASLNSGGGTTVSTPGRAALLYEATTSAMGIPIPLLPSTFAAGCIAVRNLIYLKAWPDGRVCAAGRRVTVKGGVPCSD